MKERKLSKSLWFRIIFFILTVIVFCVVPMPQKGDILSQNDVWWPFNLLSQGQLGILTLWRRWLIDYLIIFAGVLVALEVTTYLGILRISKHKIVKVVVSVLFLSCFLSLLYFTLGSIQNMWTLWPMSVEVWTEIFGKGKMLWAWWAGSAVLLHVSIKA